MRNKKYYENVIKELKEENPFLSNTNIAHQLLLEDIVSWNLKPGEKISQESIATLFEMSRTPIRDALAQLETEGYIEKNSSSGYQVPQVRLKDYVDFFEYRLLIEPQAAYWAARNITMDELESLAENLTASEKAVEEKKIRRFLRLDQEFHDIIIHASNNDYLIEGAKVYSKKKELYAQFLVSRGEQVSSIINKHRLVYEAIHENDEDKAKEAMRSHLGFYIRNIYNCL